MKEEKQLVFIVGSGRSGTTLLRNILEHHPCVGVSPELKFFDVILANRTRYLFKSWDQKKRIIANRMYRKSMQSEDPLWQGSVLSLAKIENTIDTAKNYDEIFLSLLDLYSTNRDAPIQIEKTPSNVFFLKKIAKKFPNARFIHIVRDGREVVASAKKREWSENVEELSLWWVLSLDAFRKFTRSLVGKKRKYIEVKYENLITNSESELEKVFKFLSISWSGKSLALTLSSIKSFSSFYKNKRGIYKSEHFKLLPQREQQIINVICSKYLSPYGYKSDELIKDDLYSWHTFFLKTKLTGNIWARKIGIFWFWSKVGEISKTDNREELNKQIMEWWEKHPFTLGVGAKNYKKSDLVGGIPVEDMDLKYFLEIERKFRKHSGIGAQKLGDRLLSKLANFSELKGKSVLDVATGPGVHLVAYADAGAYVTGIDLTNYAVQQATKNLRARDLPGIVRQMDAQDMQFKDEIFDFVNAWGCLMHMPDTELAIREIYRVLKPEGKCLAYMYNKSSWPFWFNIFFLRGVLLLGLIRYRGNIDKLTSRYSDGSSIGGNMLTKFYSPRQVEKMFKNAGFNKVEVAPWDIGYEPNHWPMRSFPIFKFLPKFIKKYMSKNWGYGLIIHAEK